ncbi:MAG: M42 family metallopeptidase [Clostridia bacterium]|nr:M42 family metallopeptidase [Clostridia bacterium]
MLELLKELCAERAPSGCEAAVAQRIIKEIGPYAELRTDALGNVIAFKKGDRPAKTRLMLCAHMDEVGLIVTCITGDGFLKFAAVGGIDPRVMAGRRVLIGAGGIPGVIGMKVLHLLEGDEAKTAPSIEKLYIDIGVATRQEAERLVSPGDTAVFDSQFEEFGDGFIKARAIDDRIGCAMLVQMIRQPQPFDLTFAFTVQEEVGSCGAKAATFAVAPEAAIVVEATTAADIPFVVEEKRVCFVGRGPVVSFMDKGTVYDRALYRLAFSLAEQQGISCQPKKATAGGNDAASVHVSREGVRTAAVSLPCRYLHSPSCVIKWSDAEETLRLLSALSAAVAGGGAA